MISLMKRVPRFLIEQERRANLAQIPATIQELADKYAEGGGDREELLKAVGDSE